MTARSIISPTFAVMHSREPADIISGSLSHGRLFEMSDLWKAVLESANIAEDSEDAKRIQ